MTVVFDRKPVALKNAEEVRILAKAFAPLDARALGIATGAVVGGGIFLATGWLVVKGGVVVGPNLSLLGQFFPGFEVTWPGALVGMAYGTVLAFLVGLGIALLRNAIVFRFLRQAQ